MSYQHNLTTALQGHSHRVYSSQWQAKRVDLQRRGDAEAIAAGMGFLWRRRKASTHRLVRLQLYVTRAGFGPA